jgi:hypothetical protein
MVSARDNTIERVGACHCGAIGFAYFTRLEPQSWSVRACQCRFCRAHRSRATSDPAGTIRFNENIPDALVRYRFGQRSTDFLLCRHCGVYIGALMESAQGKFGIININALQSIPSGLNQSEPREYGDETPDQRIARREALWSRVI